MPTSQSRFLCSTGVSKHFKLHTLTDVEHVDANANADGSPARMRTRPRELSRILGSFHSSTEDVVFTLKPRKAGKSIDLLSYDASAQASGKTIMSIDTEQQWVVDYKHLGDTDAKHNHEYESTVSMKDLRAGTALCESLGRDACISVRGVGSPFFLTAENFAPSSEVRTYFVCTESLRVYYLLTSQIVHIQSRSGSVTATLMLATMTVPISREGLAPAPEQQGVPQQPTTSTPRQTGEEREQQQHNQQLMQLEGMGGHFDDSERADRSPPKSRMPAATEMHEAAAMNGLQGLREESNLRTPPAASASQQASQAHVAACDAAQVLAQPVSERSTAKEGMLAHADEDLHPAQQRAMVRTTLHT
jgi:hypothetical protein